MYRLSAICHSASAGGRPRIPAGFPKWRPGCAWNRGGSSDPRAAGPPGGREAAPPAPIHVCGYKYVCVPRWLLLLPPASRRLRRSLAWVSRLGSAPSPGMCAPLPALPPGLPPARTGGHGHRHGHGHGRARSPGFRPRSSKAGDVAAPGASAAGREGLELPRVAFSAGQRPLPYGHPRVVPAGRQERQDLRWPRPGLAAAGGQEKRACSSLRYADGAAAV
ncbi:translation initiation factor IF-2-like [Molothrus ater]|uniref:translation initiation factor IF-2-like n=1 Tax=Molothrus ater TaxID=84834 RepID=UPI0023E7F8D6|nr:translation initiation factor IF-2-like [Molothrus ater]